MSIPRSRRLFGLAQSDIRAMTRECQRLGGINLGQGICDLPTPPVVRDAAIRAIEERRSTYSYPEGLAELRAAIAAKLARDNGLAVDPEREVVVTTGSAAAFACTLHALLDPGDGLLVLEPYYGYHVNAARVAGIDVQTLRLEPPRFRLAVERVREALRPNTRALLLCTPSNPSGRMLSRAEIADLAALAAERDLLVVTDEIYEYITYDGREHVSPASVAGLFERCVTIMGLSKTFSITGWRLGYAVAPAAMAEAITLVHDLFYICAPTPLQHGVAAGLALGPEYYQELRADYAAKRALLCSALDAAGLPAIRPEGAYYVLSDVRRLGRPRAREAAQEILERTGVATVPGSAFYDGEGGEGLVRLCFAKEWPDLEEAGRRLQRLA